MNVSADIPEAAKQEVIYELLKRPFLLAVIPGPSSVLDEVADSVARAAIAAFCKAEGLTVEERFATYDAKLGPSDPQQRLVGEWKAVPA